MIPIKNIIFDLGGVLLNIDYNLTKKAFIDLGFTRFDDMYNQYRSDEFFSKLETGKISNEEFYDKMIAIAEEPITADQVKHAWNAMLLDFREQSLQQLEKLSASYQLFLLSNTNRIHWEAFDSIFREKTGKPSLDDYFTKAWYSHNIGFRKPNEDIFEFVLKDGGLKATETLFIDDSFNNIATAKNMGFQTHLLLAGEQIENLELYDDTRQ